MKGRIVFNPPLEYPIDQEKGICLQVDEAARTSTGIKASVATINGDLLHSAGLDLGSEVASRRYAKTVAEKTARRNKDAKNDHEKIEPLDAAIVFDKLIEMAVALKREVDARQATTEEHEAAAPSEEEKAQLWRACEGVATDSRLMERLDRALDQLGLVRENTNRRLIYLAAASRLLKKPINVVVKAQASTGKNFLLETVLRLFPETAFVNYTCVSPKYLNYTDDDLRHRIVLICEARAMAEDDMLAYIIRSLLSEGQIVTGTVGHDELGNPAAQRVVKEGPTSLFTSTTLPEVEGDTETRLLSVQADESVEQTRAVVRGVAREFECANERVVDDLEALVALQRWLEVCGARRVVVPYASQIGDGLEIGAVRARRDISKILTLVQASALLHQKQRPCEDGAVIAQLADYEIVYPLLAPTMAVAQQGGLTERHRAIVARVRAQYGATSAAEQSGVTIASVARALGLPVNTAWRIVRKLIREGYLKNLEQRKNHPAVLVPGDDLPPPLTAMPHPSSLLEEVIL